MTLRLRVATKGARDPHLFVGVEKRAGGAPVPFEGSYGYGRDHVAQGRLRLALRELDEELSTPHQPEYAFRRLLPVRDGEEVEATIALTPSATLFHAGESLRLMIAGRYLQPRNPLFGHFPTRYERSRYEHSRHEHSRSGIATIAWEPGRSSALEIPVIPGSRSGG